MNNYDIRKQFKTGIVILSLDTEQIWGYLDQLSEKQFQRTYPGALEAHWKLLTSLTNAGISATWFLVGGMALQECEGPWDRRMAGLPFEWTKRIRDGCARTAPLWYHPSFVEHLRRATPVQEIGLHGGLTHFIWTHPSATREVVAWELAQGVKALQQAGVNPLSFSYGREQEAFYDLLPASGFQCYRSRTVMRAFQRGCTISGKLSRLLDELRRATPPPVWPQETAPGFWKIPASLFLYPIRRSRTRVAGLPTRIARFNQGVDAAARHRGIFHFGLHPENLTESPHGFSMFEAMLERLILSRSRGDIEILTMREVAARMEPAASRKGTGPVSHQVQESAQRA
jgi:hypothetical protein